MIKKSKLIIIVTIILLLAVSISVLFYLYYFGRLEVEAMPKNAHISIGSKKFTSNQLIKVRPGEYNISIAADGYEAYVFLNYEIKFNKDYFIKRKLITLNEAKLQRNLPFDDGLSFTIETRDAGDRYIYDIGLYAILNRADQVQSYNEQLTKLKPLAIEYIKSFGVDPNNIEINWLQSDVNQ